MSDISQRIKYAVEIDASSLDKFAKQLTDAKAQMDNMLSSVSGLARAFEAVGGKTLKVKQTIVQQGEAVRVTTAAVRDAKDAAEGYDAAMEALEKDLKKAASAQGQFELAQRRAAVIASRASMANGQLARNLQGVKAAVGMAAFGIRKASADMEKLEKSTRTLGGALKGTSNDGLQFLKVFGKFQAIKWLVRETFDLFKEGAQNLDLKRTLGAQIAGFDQLVAEVNQRTAGTIKEADLNKSLALMTSFGLEVKTLPRSMELVTKAAIRTGQSTEYLTESFARGVSRMSPLILDNLGIQLKLTDAYDEFAKKVGKATDALTKNEQIAAVQQATLKALEETTRGIVLEDSAGASAARFEKFFADAWMGIKEIGGMAIQAVDRATETSTTSARRVIEQLKVVNAEMFASLFDMPPDAVKRMQDTIKLLDGVSDTIAGLGEYSEMNVEGVINSILWGAADPNKSMATTMDVLSEFDDNFSKLLTDTQIRTLGSGGGGTLAETIFGSLASGTAETMKREIETALKAYEEQKGKILSVEERSVVLAELQASITSAVATTIRETSNVLQDENATREDIVRLAERTNMFDADRFQFALKTVRTIMDAREQAERLNAENAAFVQSLQDSIKARARELEYADKTHILQIDANKAKTEEARLTQEIAKVVAAYNDEEQAANRGANLAKLKQLELAKKIAIATTDGAKAAWDIEQERVKDIIKAGKAAVQAELLRLDTFIKQNEVLLTQLEVYAQMPGMALAMTAASAKMRNDIEIAKDSAAMLKTHLTGLGGSRGGGRAPSEPDFSVRKQFDKQRNNRSLFSEGKKEAMRMFKEFREMLNVQPAGSDVWGFFGLNDESVKTWFKDVVSLRDKIVDKFGNFAELARVLGPNWQADFEGLTSQLEHLDALMSHFERLKDVADGIDRFNVALGDMNNGLRGLEELFGEPGQRWVGALNDMKTALDGMSEALRNNADAYQLSLAGVAISRSLTQNIIKDLRARAAVEGGMQTALAAAAFATGNIPGGIAHSAAAALFFGLALKGKKAVAKKDTPSLSGSGNMRVARSDVHVHIAGTVVQTEAERGVMIQRAIREARAGGR